MPFVATIAAAAASLLVTGEKHCSYQPKVKKKKMSNTKKNIVEEIKKMKRNRRKPKKRNAKRGRKEQ